MVTELPLIEGIEIHGLEKSDHLIQNVWPEVNMEIPNSLSLAHSITSVFNGFSISGLVAT